MECPAYYLARNGRGCRKNTVDTSTVSTKHKAGQGIGDAGGICPAHRPLHLLGELPGFRVNNGLVGVLSFGSIPC